MIADADELNALKAMPIPLIGGLPDCSRKVPPIDAPSLALLTKLYDQGWIETLEDGDLGCRLALTASGVHEVNRASS